MDRIEAKTASQTDNFRNEERFKHNKNRQSKDIRKTPTQMLSLRIRDILGTDQGANSDVSSGFEGLKVGGYWMKKSFKAKKPSASREHGGQL